MGAAIKASSLSASSSCLGAATAKNYSWRILGDVPRRIRLSPKFDEPKVGHTSRSTTFNKIIANDETTTNI